MTAPQILVVDDEPTVREIIAEYLEREGFTIHQMASGRDVVETVQRIQPALVILDVMLPERNGIDILRALQSSVPVILLTARADESDRVIGLELGADDYVVKPFSPRELVARVRSVLRRSSPPDGQTKVLHFDGLTIDVSAREVLVGGQAITLTAMEFNVLTFLASHPREAFSRAQLLTQVWDSSAEYQDPATVTVHIRRVRSKLEVDPLDPRWISTVWGVGYRFEP